MGASFDHATPAQRVVFDSGGAVDRTSAIVGELGAHRVLLISGGSSAAVAARIADRIPVAATVGEVAQHVPVELANAAAEVAREAGIDLIVSVGGGSATGLAKIVALRTDAPIVAVPTTFAGSEATDVWGVTEASRKTTGTDPRALPRVVVYDAELSASLPVAAAVASGLNAVAHAVDGFWAPRADPINAALGSEGLRLLVPGLRALAADPAPAAALEARERILSGAYLAAIAFASAGSGMHHKICHVLGGTFGLPHAPTHAVVLPYVAALNAPAAPQAAERISAALDGAPAARGLDDLRRELGAPGSLAELGLEERDLRTAAELALEAIPPSNPHEVTLADVVGVLRAAWAGDPID